MKNNKDFVEAQGVITESLPDARFKVELESGHFVTVTLSGKMRKYRINCMPGDSVTVELSVYDLAKGRITRRNKIEKKQS